MNKSKLDPKKEIPADLVAVTPIEDVIKNEIQKFDIKEKDIDTAVEAYRSLKIVGIEDKDGYEAVSQARVVFRNMRTAIEKRRKELKEDSLKIGRAIDAEAARLTSKFVDTEKLLAGYIEEIDSEKERIKREEKERIEREKRERIESRVSSLRSIGFTWSGGAFYDFDGDNPITTVQIDEMIDDDFNAFTLKHKARYNEWLIAEEKRKAEEARAKAEQEAEARRLAEQMKIERERALAEQKKLEEEREKFRIEKAEVERQRKELEDKMAKQLKDEWNKPKPPLDTPAETKTMISADPTNFPPKDGLTINGRNVRFELNQLKSVAEDGKFSDEVLDKLRKDVIILLDKTIAYIDKGYESWQTLQNLQK